MTLTTSGTTLHILPRSSLAVAAFSTVVEWYDFTLYLFMTTVLSRVFFGSGAGSLLTTLAVFAIAYVMRPLGALVFGHLGDRYGRRQVLLASMTMMSIAMLATALLPIREQIGPAAGLLLLLLRCVMGFSVGGEYTGVMTYLVEGAVPRRRGLVASLAAAASEIGALLAVAVTAVTTALVRGPALESWGWRIPFLVGAVLAAGTLIARTVMRESPAFAGVQQASATTSRPLRQVLRFQRAALYRTFAISALGSITYYVGITYVPTYLVAVGGFAEDDALWLATVASAAVIAVTPLAGWLADRFGRRPTILVFAFLSVTLPVAMFAIMNGGGHTPALAGAVVLALLAGGVSAVGASASPEQFPVAGRLSGLAVATVATTVFGGLTPYLAQLLVDTSGWRLVPGVMVAAVALATLPVLWRLPETSHGLRGGDAR
ncbi:MFS transporter [Actinoplanes sp. NBRC 101535]|uniref:MFS transporter n=1 Tax=Actinoplanes sp. NBRC 101535 TaxID=3032196 RepID=UPI0024A1A07E|nr:MFS transporter [Actinoplanes sp. NBRC 101535]GLY06636.1 MFS transporter [Actinoplanes sp. NBRC 101535]